MSERGGFVGGPRKVSRRARRGKRESLRQPESSETAKSTLRVSTCRELNRAIREVSAVIRVSAFARYLAFAPGDKSDRPDRSRTLPRRRTGTPPDAQSRRSRSRARLGSVHVKAAPGVPQIARRVRIALLSFPQFATRCFRPHPLATGRSARPRSPTCRRSVPPSAPSRRCGDLSPHPAHRGSDRESASVGYPPSIG